MSWLNLDYEHGNPPAKPSQQSIFAVIVLYKTTLEECVSYQTLQQAALEVRPEALALRILLYDNNPHARVPESLPANVEYLAGASNRGLADAYNAALSMAVEHGFDWLLTLDQDTQLPIEALLIYSARTAAVADSPGIAAVVPQIIAAGRMVSPNYFAAGAWPTWFPRGFSGVPARKVYAFNSGSLVRVSALRQIGGYSPWFWLDNSDAAMFRRLDKFGKQVCVAGELVLDHDFSMLNMRERMSPERYRTVLLAESAFWDLEMNALAGLERTTRLAVRVFKHRLRADPGTLSRLTASALRARLFRSRASRIRAWREATRTRLNGILDGWLSLPRPRVSVCMAAYNGQQFIEAQLRSIVPQLSAEDEIVIVDDKSRDATVQRILAYRATLTVLDPRVRLIQHEINRGVVGTFEDALRAATGDVLFLCDDDDLWVEDRVEKVLAEFGRDSQVQVVCTGVSLIDEEGLPMADQSFLGHRKFSASVLTNLWHNQFQGSAMAFRASLLEHVLPLPAGYLFLHDAWIGLLNTLTGGKTVYLEEPLLLYRRHSGNYSRQFSRSKQVLLRLQLVAMLMRKRMRMAFSG